MLPDLSVGHRQTCTPRSESEGSVSDTGIVL